MVEATETFKQHYDNLRTIAEKMRSQQEPDIDQLIPMVDSALGSYKVCKDRLDAVKKLLDERFGAEVSPAWITCARLNSTVIRQSTNSRHSPTWLAG
jgi:exodeoxyribonuclease VII small subunit